jgi:hypothetical protein
MEESHHSNLDVELPNLAKPKKKDIKIARENEKLSQKVDWLKTIIDKIEQKPSDSSKLKEKIKNFFRGKKENEELKQEDSNQKINQKENPTFLEDESNIDPIFLKKL